jgi:hypothetical protein
MNKRGLPLFQRKPKSDKVKLTFQLKPGENVSVHITAQGATQVVTSEGAEEQPRVRPGEQQGPISVTVSTSQPAFQPKRPGFAFPAPVKNVLAHLDSPKTILGIVLALYLITRLIGLGSFPISFYADEAAPVMRAADFLSYGMKDFTGTLFPTFFLNGNQFSLGTTVYLQVIALLLFGKSVFVARAVTVLVGLLGMYWFSMTLIKLFKISYAWVGAFLLVATPCWFMYSRMALETPIFTVLYAGFIYYYLLYRLRDPRFLFPALVIGALAFYTYLPGQVVMVATGVLLLLIDAPYHWQQRKITLIGLALLLVLVVPLVRFLIAYPNRYIDPLSVYSSFLVSNQPLLSKIGTYLLNWLYGLSPLFWFNPDPQYLIWWVMKGYSPIAWYLAPFWAWGLVVAVRKWRKPEIRVMLAAYLAGPTGSALVSIEIARVLMTIIPLMLIITLGLSDVLERLQKRFTLVSEKWAAPLLAGLLIISTAGMTADALIHAPTWSTNYGINGLQWGAQEVFSTAIDLSKAYPDQTIRISGGWDWQPDILKRFFVPDEMPIELGNADIFMSEYKPEISNTIFILIPQDYQAATASDKFSSVDVMKTITAPDGSPAFYVVRLTYVPNAQAVFQAQREEQIQLVSDTVTVNGLQLTVWHTRLDADLIGNLFDGNPDTYAHTEGVNPLVLDWALPTQQKISGIRVHMGSEHAVLTLTVTDANGSQVTKEVDAPVNGVNKDVTVMLDTPVTSASHIHFELNDVDAAPDSDVHLWEITVLNQGQ